MSINDEQTRRAYEETLRRLAEGEPSVTATRTTHVKDEPRRCDCSCHRCCVPLDASCEDCEEEHPEP